MEKIDYEKYLEVLRKRYNYNKKNIYAILKDLSEDEIVMAFADDKIYNYFLAIKEPDFLAMVFRMVPSSIQELIWNNTKYQKALLGISECSDEDLIEAIKNDTFYMEDEVTEENKNQEFCFSKSNIRQLEIFLKSIKSEKILYDLSHNMYFQAILVCGKKLPKSILSKIDAINLFNSIVNGSIYKIATSDSQRECLNFFKSIDTTMPFDEKKVDVECEDKEKYGTIRNEVKVCNFLSDDMTKRIETIRRLDEIIFKIQLESLKEVTSISLVDSSIKCAFYGDDWYVLINQDNEVFYDCTATISSKALQIMQATLSTVYEHLNKKDLNLWLLTLKNN